MGMGMVSYRPVADVKIVTRLYDCTTATEIWCMIEKLEKQQQIHQNFKSSTTFLLYSSKYRYVMETSKKAAGNDVTVQCTAP